MKIIKFIPTALVIVAAGLSCGTVNAKIALDHSPVTVATCKARFDLKLPIDANTESAISLLQADKKRSAESAARVQTILDTLSDADFRSGSLTNTECVGSSTTSRVRTREYQLDRILRHGSERRGYRYSVKANDERERVLRSLKLKLPPADTWQLSSSGNALVAAEELFHPSALVYELCGESDTTCGEFKDPQVPADFPLDLDAINESGNGYAIDVDGRKKKFELNRSVHRRIRVTELRRLKGAIQVTQRVSDNGAFAELNTWIIKEP